MHHSPMHHSPMHHSPMHHSPMHYWLSSRTREPFLTSIWTSFSTVNLSLICRGIFILIIVAAYAVLNLHPVGAQAFNDFEIEKNVSITEGKNGVLEIDLGTLKPGQAGLVKINVVNDSDRNFQFKRIVVGCSCLNANTSKKELPPTGEMTLTTTLKLPFLSTRIDNAQSIVVECEGRGSLEFLLKFRLSDVCSFRNATESHTVQPDAGKAEFVVPLVISEDVDVANHRFFAEGGLEKAQVSLMQDRKQLKIAMEITSSANFTTFGDLCIENILTKKILRITCFVTSQADVSFYPKTLVFTRKEKTLQATLLVRASRTLISTANGAIDFSAAVKIEGIASTLTHRMVGNGVCRITVEVKESDYQEYLKNRESTPYPNAKFQIGWSNGVIEPLVKISFPEGEFK
jgi:hypothetical protein